MKLLENLFRKIVKQSRNFISFWLYRIADGLAKSIGFFLTDLMTLLYHQEILEDMTCLMSVESGIFLEKNTLIKNGKHKNCLVLNNQ